MPRRPGTRHPDVRTRIEAVARTGYKGFGQTRADLIGAKDAAVAPSVAQMLRDNGIERGHARSRKPQPPRRILRTAG